MTESKAEKRGSNHAMPSQNRKWLDEFSKIINTKTQSSQVKQFLESNEFCERSFSSFLMEEVKEYFHNLEGQMEGTSIDNRINAVKAFRKYLVDNNEIDASVLPELGDLRLNAKGHSIEGSLSFNQIGHVRKLFLKRAGKYKRQEYLFEICYQLGIQKEQIKLCIPANDEPEIQCFKNEESDPEKYNKKIKKLLEELSPEDRVKINHLKSLEVPQYLKTLGDNLKKKYPETFPEGFKLGWTMISNTHIKNFFECPICGRNVENIAENWVLYEYDKDQGLRLVCSECKGSNL